MSPQVYGDTDSHSLVATLSCIVSRYLNLPVRTVHVNDLHIQTGVGVESSQCIIIVNMDLAYHCPFQVRPSEGVRYWIFADKRRIKDYIGDRVFSKRVIRSWFLQFV